MWNPFKQNRPTEGQDIPKDIKPTGNSERKERKFQNAGSGSFWTVFNYTDRNIGKIQENLLAKKLRGHFLFPEYPNNEDPNFTKEVAKYLRRERDHLQRSYNSELPDLIPDEKIITLPPKEGHPAGEIISVQEKIQDFKKLHQFKIDDLNPEQQEELRTQIDTFIQITKNMVDAEDPVDPEFSHAIPDITHLGNLAVEMKDNRPIFKLFDTNYVVPMNSERAIEQNLLLRNSYWLFYIEHHILGRPVSELQADPFYRKTHMADTIAQYYLDVPLLDQKELSSFFRLQDGMPIIALREKERVEKQDLQNTRLERLQAFLLTIVPTVEIREYDGNKQLHIPTSYGECVISAPEPQDIETSEESKNPLLVRRRIKTKEGVKSEILTIDENMIEEFIAREI